MLATHYLIANERGLVDRWRIELQYAACKAAILPLNYQPIWWTKQDFNLRPIGCKPIALATELLAHIKKKLFWFRPATKEAFSRNLGGEKSAVFKVPLWTLVF